MRAMLYVAAALVLIISIPLNLASDNTRDFFAWTIDPPLTAAFLGASYLAAFVLEFMSARQPVWAKARIAVPAVWLFTTLTLVASLIHLDRFHLGAPLLVTLVVTWSWLVVYAVVPIILGSLWLAQARKPGGDPFRQAPLPGWLKAILVAQCATMVVLGVALFLFPAQTLPIWPWRLTPLTARAVAAWLIGIGVALSHTAWENDFARSMPVMVSMALLGVLQLLTVARYPVVVDWASVGSWIYLAVNVVLVGVGGYGAVQARKVAMAAHTRQ